MSLPQNDVRRKSNCATTRCARLTGSGTSAIAVIGLSGPRAAEIVASRVRLAADRALRPNQVRYGAWTSSGNDESVAESVVVSPSESGFEIHCHGGPAAVQRIIEDMQQAGAEIVDQSTWETDSPLAGDFTAHEAVLVLGQCRTRRTAAIAMDQVRGALGRWAVQNVDPKSPSDLESIHAQAKQLMAYGKLTVRLDRPLRVVLVGPPNVGKSSVLNAIVGFDRSITHDGPGTTRDLIDAATVVDGLPIRVSDTAGIRDSPDPIEREGVERARVVINHADLVLAIDEPVLKIDETDAKATIETRQAFDDFMSGVAVDVPVIRVLNKCDLIEEIRSDPGRMTTRLGTEKDDVVRVSATRGDGIETLLAKIADAFERLVPPAGQPAPINRRQQTVLQRVVESVSMEQVREALRELRDGR